jgi:translation initiation factor 4E
MLPIFYAITFTCWIVFNDQIHINSITRHDIHTSKICVGARRACAILSPHSRSVSFTGLFAFFLHAFWSALKRANVTCELWVGGHISCCIFLFTQSALKQMSSIAHPLKHKWSLYFDTAQANKDAAAGAAAATAAGDGTQKTSGAASGKWTTNLQHVCTFDTVEGFWQLFNNIKTPSVLESASYRLFKHDIEPKWEDVANAKGGKWTVVVPQQSGRLQLIDKHWLNSVLSVIGERLDTDGEQICGVIISVRRSQDKIVFWTRDASAAAAVKTIGKRIKAELDLPDIRLQYQTHFDSKTNLYEV